MVQDFVTFIIYSISAVRSVYLTLRLFKIILLLIFTQKIDLSITRFNTTNVINIILSIKMINLFRLTKLQK